MARETLTQTFPAIARTYQKGKTTPLPRVQIENPLSGHGWTKLKKATQYVRRGLAVWVKPGVQIRFIRDETDHREQSVRKAIAYGELLLRRGYDTDVLTHMATLDQIAGLPCVAPVKLIRDGGQRFVPRAQKCGPVRSPEVPA